MKMCYYCKKLIWPGTKTIPIRLPHLPVAPIVMVAGAAMGALAGGAMFDNNVLFKTKAHYQCWRFNRERP